MRYSKMREIIKEQREQLKDAYNFSQKLQNKIWDFYDFFKFIKIIALFIAFVGAVLYFVIWAVENG